MPAQQRLDEALTKVKGDDSSGERPVPKTLVPVKSPAKGKKRYRYQGWSVDTKSAATNASEKKVLDDQSTSRRVSPLTRNAAAQLQASSDDSSDDSTVAPPSSVARAPKKVKRSNRDVDWRDSLWQKQEERGNGTESTATETRRVTIERPSQPVVHNPYASATNGKENSTNRKPAAAQWTSTKQAKQFVAELDQPPRVAEPPLGVSLDSSSWMTSRRKRAPVPEAPVRAPQPGDPLWDESSSQPKYAYQETVRCKEARQGLPCHDCPQCKRFYEVLRKTGHEVDFSQGIMQHGRHRNRYRPPDTPEDFWELDFLDEKDNPRSQWP
jgi:hypothetical protein